MWNNTGLESANNIPCKGHTVWDLFVAVLPPKKTCTSDILRREGAKVVAGILIQTVWIACSITTVASVHVSTKQSIAKHHACIWPVVNRIGRPVLRNMTGAMVHATCCKRAQPCGFGVSASSVNTCLLAVFTVFTATVFIQKNYLQRYEKVRDPVTLLRLKFANEGAAADAPFKILAARHWQGQATESYPQGIEDAWAGHLEAPLHVGSIWKCVRLLEKCYRKCWFSFQYVSITHS